MGPTGIDVFGVVVGLDTLLGLGIAGADGRDAVLHRNAIGAGVGAKVRIEGAVLLHYDDDVLDLVNVTSAGWLCGGRRRGWDGRRGRDSGGGGRNWWTSGRCRGWTDCLAARHDVDARYHLGDRVHLDAGRDHHTGLCLRRLRGLSAS